VKRAVQTPKAPLPAGTYSQAIVTSGTLVFISGQTPRFSDGQRLIGADFEAQALQAMENLKAIAEAAGGTLDTHCAKVTVYLRDIEDRFAFDRVYAKYVGKTPPARAIVQSNFVEFDVEVEAILAL